MAERGYDVHLIAPHRDGRSVTGVTLHGIYAERLRLNRLFRIFCGLPLALGKLIAIRPDIVHIHDPELLLLAPFIKIFGMALIYDMHEDLVKQVLSKAWIPSTFSPFVSKIIQALLPLQLRFADALVVATPGLRKSYCSFNPALVRNFPKLNNFPPREINISSPYLIYVGAAISWERGLREMLELVNRFDGRLRLRLIGNFYPPELKTEASIHPGWVYVDWCPRLPFDQLADQLKGATVGLVLEHGTPNHIDAYPTKLFDYMGASLPVIANDVPLWASIIRRAKCGFSARFDDIDMLQSFVEKLISDDSLSTDLGNNSRAAIEKEFNWDNEANALFVEYVRLSERSKI